MAAKKLRRARREGRKQTTASRPMPTSMQLLVSRLSLIGDVITTVELALRAQNADHDAAFAMNIVREGPRKEKEFTVSYTAAATDDGRAVVRIGD